ncbi:MAG: AbgT family transporter, partial [bacterium]
MSGRTAFLSRALTVFLSTVERGGNALPHPGTLFAILAGVIVLVSAVAARTGIEVVHPGTGELIQPVSLATVAGLHRILTEMVTNFTSFAPLGTVLVSMLGIGVLESSGLIGAGLRLLVLSAPKHLLTFVIVLAGVLSNTASEIGYVLLVPLGGIIFLGAGRHPIAGLAAAFAGVSGGYSANLLLGTVDPLLAGLSEEAARIVDDGYRVNPAANYYFMVVSTFVIATAGTWVTERIVIPRLGAYEGQGDTDAPDVLQELSRIERRGLGYALLAAGVFVAFLLWGTVPADGFLRNPETGGLLRSPFLSGIVAFIFLGGTVVGVAYGAATGAFRNDADVMNGMGKTI